MNNVPDAIRTLHSGWLHRDFKVDLPMSFPASDSYVEDSYGPIRVETALIGLRNFGKMARSGQLPGDRLMGSGTTGLGLWVKGEGLGVRVGEEVCR